MTNSKSIHIERNNMNYYNEIKEKLMIEVDKKYNERNLRYMRQFYEMIYKFFRHV